MIRATWTVMAAALTLVLALVGCESSNRSVRDGATVQPSEVLVELPTYVQWSEGATRLYAVIGAGWPPSGLARSPWQQPAHYTVEPAVGVREVRLLDDGMTVCLTTAPQQPGAIYRVRFKERAVFSTPPLEGFPQSRVLTVVAVDANHLVVVPDIHHLDQLDWADRNLYRCEPSLAVLGAEIFGSGQLVRLTTATQDPSEKYVLIAAGFRTPVVR